MRFRFILTCLAVALMCSSAVWAQPGGERGPDGRRPGGPGGPGGGFGRGGGMSLLGLLGIEAVQKELELSEDQIAAIKKLQEELGGPRGGFGFGPGGPGPGGRRPDGQGGQGGEGRRPQRPPSNDDAPKSNDEAPKSNKEALRNHLGGTYFVQQEQPPRRNFDELSDEERQKLLADRQKEAAERAQKEKEKLGEILSPQQMKRLQEISIQVRGTRALEDPEVAKELGITESQQKDLMAVREKMGAEMRELFQPGEDRDFNAAREKMAELRKKSDEAILAILDADQQKKFEELKGKPFEMPAGDFRGGPGGPGGPGGRRPDGQGGQGGGQRPARPDA